MRSSPLWLSASMAAKCFAVGSSLDGLGPSYLACRRGQHIRLESNLALAWKMSKSHTLDMKMSKSDTLTSENDQNPIP